MTTQLPLPQIDRKHPDGLTDEERAGTLRFLEEAARKREAAEMTTKGPNHHGKR